MIFSKICKSDAQLAKWIERENENLLILGGYCNRLTNRADKYAIANKYYIHEFTHEYNMHHNVGTTDSE